VPHQFRQGIIGLVHFPVEGQKPGQFPLIDRVRNVIQVDHGFGYPGVPQDSGFVLSVLPVVASAAQLHHPLDILRFPVNVYEQPVLAAVQDIIPVPVNNGDGHICPQSGVILEPHCFAQQRFL
jgi:hypothetical protein